MGGDELEIIAKHFAPLATHPAARKLQDDLAVLQTRGPLALTTDTIVEGVHFRGRSDRDRREEGATGESLGPRGQGRAGDRGSGGALMAALAQGWGDRAVRSGAG